MKRFENIVQSETAPNTNSFWIKDNVLKYFNNGQWVPLSYQENGSNNNGVIDNLKEILDFLEGFDDDGTLKDFIEFQITDIRNKLSKAEDDVNKLEEQKDSMKTTINAHESSINTLEQNVSNLTTQVDSIKPYTLPVATKTTLGGVKSATTGTTSGRDYKVQINSDGTMKVNVPWVDLNTTYAKATDTTLGLVMIGYTENDKNYPVELDENGKMFVNVPWTDANTTYDVATQSANGLMSSTDKQKLDTLILVPTGGTAGQVLKKTSDGVAWQNDNNTTYSVASDSSNGLMSSTDKSKLDNIASNANNYTLPNASTSARGGVLMATAVTDLAGTEDATAICTKVNALLSALRASGALQS